MSEAVVVNLFLMVRVALVGGILLIFPRITRKGLLFGVYVGEEFAAGDQGRRLIRSWDTGCLMIMAISVLIGLTMSFLGHPVAGNLTGTGFLLSAGFGLYLRSHSKVRPLTPAGVERQAELGTATLQSERPRGETFAMFTTILCVLTALATLTYAIISYRAMPVRVPSLSSPFGLADGWTTKSIEVFIFPPTLNLLLSPIYALGAWLTTSAKLSVREGTDFRSVAAQMAFRTTTANILSGTSLLICAFLTLYSVQMIRIGLSETQSLGSGIWFLPPAFILFALGSLVRVFMGIGQGGALMERGSEDRGLTGALADNAHWVLGLFYVNREDPSMIIESRFGIGYTFNYGNRISILLTVAMIVLALLIVTLVFLMVF